MQRVCPLARPISPIHKILEGSFALFIENRHSATSDAWAGSGYTEGYVEPFVYEKSRIPNAGKRFLCIIKIC